jgi:hypothetical protein
MNRLVPLVQIKEEKLMMIQLLLNAGPDTGCHSSLHETKLVS